jgi:hypothetical protein
VKKIEGLDMKNTLVTRRDVDLFNWINGVGFVNIDQVTERYKISRETAYGRLRKLVQREYLLHERVLQNKPGHYRATKKAAEFNPLGLKPLKYVSLAKYQHTKIIVDLSLKLTEKFQARFVPERELRLDMEYEPVGHRGHLADGMLELEDKTVAIEVELTTKGRHRLRKILNQYCCDLSVKEVWYFCGSNEVRNLVESQSKGYDFVKTYLLEDWVKYKN